jgi:hypothetical protein
MKGLPFVLAFTAMTFVAWGAYGPVLHHGTDSMGRDSLRAFVGVGLAYFFIAVLVPIYILNKQGETGKWTISGTFYSLIAGAVGAVGALGVILALSYGGKAVYVMPLVFGFAPIVNTLVTAWLSKTFDQISPVFISGIVLAALGAGGVIYFKPAVVAHATHATEDKEKPEKPVDKEKGESEDEPNSQTDSGTKPQVLHRAPSLGEAQVWLVAFPRPQEQDALPPIVVQPAALSSINPAANELPPTQPANPPVAVRPPDELPPVVEQPALIPTKPSTPTITPAEPIEPAIKPVEEPAKSEASTKPEANAQPQAAQTAVDLPLATPTTGEPPPKPGMFVEMESSPIPRSDLEIHTTKPAAPPANVPMIVLSIIIAALCWGSYGPMLHQGQARMAGSRLRPFTCVGISYFIIAVAAPLMLIAYRTSDSGSWTMAGLGWSIAAGTAGALGALGVILAFNAGGKPYYVMPLVFGFAPVINTFISLTEAGTWSAVNIQFWISLAVVITGAITVLINAPKPNHKPNPPSPAGATT